VVGDPSQNSVLFPYLSWIDSLRANGLTIKENIIWDQSNSGCDTAWGSWQSASSPHIRHLTEMILVGYNTQWKKTNKGKSDITGDEFSKWTLDKWKISPERDRSHPAPFPEELAKRCIKLFSYVGDVVLDPFSGSGTTCAVAKKFGRQYIGIDLDAEYTRLAQKRLDNIPQKLELFISEKINREVESK
jgi:site-specific DNA-methyltransferase (adenine-specific)